MQHQFKAFQIKLFMKQLIITSWKIELTQYLV